MGEYGHEIVIERIDFETLKYEGKSSSGETTNQQCIKHRMPMSIKINFLRTKSRHKDLEHEVVIAFKT